MMIEADKPAALGPLIVDIEGTSLGQRDIEILNHPYIGGVILFTRNYEDKAQLTHLVHHIKSLRKPELLVCVDQEGGRVQRFKRDFTELPALHSLGILYNKNRSEALIAARMLARLMAFELRSTGIDFSFAPVVDVYDPDSLIIANRAFHSCPKTVTRLASAYIQGLHDVGMIAVAKHFPGHGSIVEDSHLCLPEDSRCYREIEEKDMYPYAQLVHRGLDSIMSAHILFDHVDDKPSGFSQFWLQQILRDKFGFQGIIFTDDLSMQGAVAYGSIIERTRLALEAGCNMALICNDRRAVEQVLDESGLELATSHERDLSGDCRRSPQLPGWEPAANDINTLLDKLNTGQVS